MVVLVVVVGGGEVFDVVDEVFFINDAAAVA